MACDLMCGAGLDAGVRRAEGEENVKQLNLLVRLGISAAAGFAALLIAAFVVTLMELYLTGHGYGSITREVITWEPAGVHMSISDLAMLTAMIVAAVSVWFLLRTAPD
jgi:hypothetical protein